MSYTMTLDVPQKTAAYIGARPQLRKELNAIFIAIVAAKMQCDESARPTENARKCIKAAKDIESGKVKAKGYTDMDAMMRDLLK